MRWRRGSGRSWKRSTRAPWTRPIIRVGFVVD
jgi:hypothetical protein